MPRSGPTISPAYSGCGSSRSRRSGSPFRPRWKSIFALFAELIVDGHRETWPLRSKRFQHWLRPNTFRATDARHKLGALIDADRRRQSDLSADTFRAYSWAA